MTNFPAIRNAVSVADPNNPDRYATVNADGSTNVTQINPATGTALGMTNSTMTSSQQATSTSAAQVLAANPARIYARIKNNDASINIAIGKDNTVTAANGYLLKPGEVVEFMGYTGALFAIAASATPSVSFLEW